MASTSSCLARLRIVSSLRPRSSANATAVRSTRSLVRVRGFPGFLVFVVAGKGAPRRRRERGSLPGGLTNLQGKYIPSVTQTYDVSIGIEPKDGRDAQDRRND